MILKYGLLPALSIFVVGCFYLYLNRYEYSTLTVDAYSKNNIEVVVRTDKLPSFFRNTVSDSCLYLAPEEFDTELANELGILRCKIWNY